MALSSRGRDPADGCGSLLGIASPGSTPPPAGSGNLTIYDAARKAYTAEYSPSAFLATVNGCVYEFGPPAINTASGAGLFKMGRIDTKVLSEYGGRSCPSTGSCLRSLWVAASADGVLAMVDPGAGDGGGCGALLAYVNGSFPGAGTARLAIVGRAAGRQLAWSPAALLGGYDGSRRVVSLIVDGCEHDFLTAGPGGFPSPLLDAQFPGALPPGVTAAFDFQPAPAAPGSAEVGYVGVSPSSCPVDACATSGYYVVWDKAGLPSSLLQTLFCSSYHLPMCEYSKRPLTLSESR